MKKTEWQVVCTHERKERLDGLVTTLRKQWAQATNLSFEVVSPAANKWELRVLGVGTEYTLLYFSNWCSGYLAAMERTHQAISDMLQAYAPNADWSRPEQLHSAVRTAGAALGKL